MRSSWKSRAHFYLGNVYRSANGLLPHRSVEISSATSIFGVRFLGGHHHLVETLRRHRQEPFEDALSTPLGRFLTGFCPQSLDESLGLETEEDPLPLFTFPWGGFKKGVVNYVKNPLASRFCGPSSKEFVEREYRSTVALYEKIRVDGYRPYLYPNSFIGGTWLVNEKNERVFVVLQGNHRVAALSALGVKKFRVRPLRGHYWEIRKNESSRWRYVENGVCSQSRAEYIFDAYFRDNGQYCKKFTVKSAQVFEAESALRLVE